MYRSLFLGNQCLLSVAICYSKAKGINLHYSHRGSCSHHVTQRPPVHSSYSCKDVCDEELQLACGTDGNTYRKLYSFFDAEVLIKSK